MISYVYFFIEHLIGGGTIQPATFFDVWANLDIIEQGHVGGKVSFWNQRYELVQYTAGINTGFEVILVAKLCQLHKLQNVLVAAHKADAGDKTVILLNQLWQVLRCWTAAVLPQKLGMAVWTVMRAAGDFQHKACLAGDLLKCNIIVAVQKRFAIILHNNA